MSYAANLTEIFSGADASTSKRWSACNFFDKVALACESVFPQYWPGYGQCRPLPGLPVEERFTGIAEVAGHLVGWQNNRLRWSSVNDFSTWIPVGATAAVLRLTVLNPFVQPNTGEATGWLWVKEPPDGLAVETFMRIQQNGTHNFYSVTEVSTRGGGVTGTLAATTVILPGEEKTLTMAAGARWVVGSRVFVGGQTQPLRVSTVSALGETPFTLKVVNEGVAPVNGQAGATVGEAYGLKLKSLGLSGGLAAGSVIEAGAVIVTENANDAGEMTNGGSEINGEIWGILEANGSGMILKEWSVQVLDYVGRPAIFEPRTLLTKEGLLGRYAWVKLQDGAMFVGHREIYRYSGEGLLPVLQQHSRQFYAELDRGRLDEIILFECEGRNEVWIVYPHKDGQTRVMVWNFLEKSVVIDDYQQQVTAGAMLDWQTDITWADLTEVWDEYEQNWEDFGSGVRERLMLLATARGGNDDAPELLLHGLDYSRKGEAYRCEAETLLFDVGDDYVFKYGDSVKVNLQVRTKQQRPKRLYCQMGARDSLDSDTIWSGVDWIEVSGNSNQVAKFDVSASGRFLALRFFSEQPDIQWRIAGFEINGRVGNSY
jgi:hypothetical protein